MKVSTHTLSNGLTVLFVDTQAFPSLTTLLFVGSGSRYESEKNNGIAHFFEHMAFKGTKKYKDAFTISSIIEGFGGSFNAFTGQDYTGYYVKAPAKHVEKSTDVIADMIQHPLLEEKEIEKEKGVIVQEIMMYEDTPQRKVFDIYDELLYGGTPLGMEIAGSPQTVNSFTKKTFTDYISKLYRPDNAVFAIAGGMSFKENPLKTEAEYLAMVEKYFGEWSGQADTTFEKVTESQAKPAVRVRFKESEQAHFCYGFRTVGRHSEEKYAQSVLSSILGRGMSSRLFIEVREKRGLCYSVGTYNDHFDEVGSMYTYAGVEPKKKTILEALKVIRHEYEDIAENGVTDEELTRAKELFRGRMILSLEDTFNVASMFGKQLLLREKYLSLDEILRKIDAISGQDIQSFAHKTFIEGAPNVALIGPFKEDTEFLKAIS